jgi:hypothetical protein
MSSAATTSKPEDETKSQKEGGEIPHLSVLEEDDEFEEFPVQGERTTMRARCFVSEYLLRKSPRD